METKTLIRAVIVDDEAHARDTVRTLLKLNCPEVQIEGEAHDVASCLELVEKSDPDLLFMDVQLGTETCFDVFAQLGNKKTNTIFITAFDNYAIPAIRLAAIDYLLKPLQPEELKKAVDRCSEQVREKQPSARMETFIQNQSSALKRIILPASKGFEVVSMNDILYCIADGNYTDFYLVDGKKIKVAKTLGEYESMLEPFGHFRIHLSHIINLSFVKEYSGGRGGIVLMSDGKELQLSQRRKQEFLQKLS